MSSLPIRTTAKIQSLRAPDLDKSKGHPATLAKAVSLHLAGKREEALKELQRAVAAGESSAEIYVAMGHIQFELGQFEQAAEQLPHAWCSRSRSTPWAGSTWRCAWSGWASWQEAAEKFQKACTLDP